MTKRPIYNLKPGTLFSDDCGCRYAVVGPMPHRADHVRVRLISKDRCREGVDHWLDYGNEPLVWDAMDCERFVEVDELTNALREAFE